MATLDIKSLIRDVPDYPTDGILFKDLTPVMADPSAMKHITSAMADHLASKDTQAVAAIDARGFIFGAPVAAELDVPFVPLRKEGKLPPPVVGTDYELEYGTARLEASANSLTSGLNVAVLDDLLATGGTAAAGAKLLESQGANIVTMAFLVELTFLDGRSVLPNGVDVYSMVQY